ncbi:MAG: DUF2794 domain-containing protein [Tabrizicola sp.]|jgi:hypothetical protein|uniref:DUF2794 domain-containing protein n=1 Tax=Tabrizicola sp. TaxID=2005166 RepID=UPI001B60783A|nr:DUF2794 domain-containing protein [Tabrizicola sp.]MCC6518049.1 DUF2794 domain-containing protein [Tabrizicola sp.]
MNAEAPIPFPQSSRIPEDVRFDRRELGLILRVYGRMVAAGEWRDYAIAAMRDLAVFAIFRRSAETPLYRIEKCPKLRSRQGLYAVVGTDGRVLRRGHDLDQVLKVLEKRLIGPV